VSTILYHFKSPLVTLYLILMTYVQQILSKSTAKVQFLCPIHQKENRSANMCLNQITHSYKTLKNIYLGEVFHSFLPYGEV
jgi:hypothetical protein